MAEGSRHEGQTRALPPEVLKITALLDVCVRVSVCVCVRKILCNCPVYPRLPTATCGTSAKVAATALEIAA